jgi:two-component system sensor histidine kinase AlgZ
VEDAVLDLAELFRAALAKEDQPSSLAEELALARQYLDIEALRLGDRLTLHWDLEDNLPLSMPLPRLTLQPLLENAVYHGIEPRAQGGELKIKGWLQGDRLHLEIENPLPQQKSGNSKGFGIAMENVRARLNALFHDRALLELQRAEGHCRVRLELPCES